MTFIREVNEAVEVGRLPSTAAPTLIDGAKAAIAQMEPQAASRNQVHGPNE